MERNWPDHYKQVLADVYNCHNITLDTFEFFNRSMNEREQLMIQRDEENRFGEPMVWIGIYIALASLFCILPMLADLLHVVKNKKLWFPCKYFTLNAASLSVIAVAMKLPMDLNNPTLGAVKFASMSFMIIMMGTLLTSLGSMDSKELLTNIIALGVLVITMVVNVCIQLQTGVLNDHIFYIAITDVAMLLLMLMIYTSSALTILKSKQILESKYQASLEKALNELAGQPPGRLTVEKLKQYVNNHWMMAVSGSPQFMVACFATTSAAAAICIVSLFLYFIAAGQRELDRSKFDSDYKWSSSVILGIQLVGVSLGVRASCYRCFAPSISIKRRRECICSRIKVFKVESHYTQMLYDWKRSSIPLSFKSRRCKVVIHNLKVLILDFCIGLQMVIVVACKMVSLILFVSIPVLTILIPLMFFPIFGVLYYCCKWLKAMFSALGYVLEREPEQLQQDDVEIAEQLPQKQYVLQLPDDVELAFRILEDISKSANHLIQKAKKQQPTNLMKLLEISSGFEGVGLYDTHQLPPSFADKYPDCWSLTLVTLATIAISLPNIQKDRVDKLLSGVSEGLAYVTLVEESLNSTEDYVIIQKASKMLWLEVEVYYKWLGNNLQNTATQVNSVEQILQRFTDTAKNLITEVENTNIDVANDNSICRSVCANSMYCITQAILSSYHDNNDIDINEVTEEDLFIQLSFMIADILAACLTNLPQVIALKCHTNAIEKREASVQAAIQLLGQTMEIINSLQDRELPNLNPAELPFIDKWRDFLYRPIP